MEKYLLFVDNFYFYDLDEDFKDLFITLMST